MSAGNAGIERVATGCRWCEGPVYFRDLRCLIWSDIPNNRLLRWDEETGAVSVFRQPANYANGNTRDHEGRLITCEQDTRRVTRTEHDGTITVLMDHYRGKPLDSPNDVVVAADGAIWFTDPGYGIQGNYESSQQRPFELPTNVYRLDPHSGAATVVADDFVRPNGLAFSPDESHLYIIDSGLAFGGPPTSGCSRSIASACATGGYSPSSSRELPMACAPTCTATSSAPTAGVNRARTGCAATPQRGT